MVSLTILKSDKSADLKSGIIRLTTPVRHPGPISVITDWAPGFISLTKNDKELKDLHIQVILKDQLNKNFNAVVNRACQDVEREIRILAPEGRKISESVLARATIAVNTILRRKEGISAYEMHTARSQDTGGNLYLKDQDLYADQQKVRETKHKESKPTDIRVGDTVTPLSAEEKHKARDIYLVTGREKDKVLTQRLLHPLSQEPIKFMSREYKISPKHLQRIHRPPGSDLSVCKEVLTKSPASTESSATITRPPPMSAKKSWSPVNPKYYEDDSSDDDDENDDQEDQDDRRVQVNINPTLPMTPPSNEEGFLMQNLPYESSESLQSSLDAISNLDLHLSNSDQSSDIQTNTSTDVLDRNYLG